MYNIKDFLIDEKIIFSFDEDNKIIKTYHEYNGLVTNLKISYNANDEKYILKYKIFYDEDYTLNKFLLNTKDVKTFVFDYPKSMIDFIKNNIPLFND